MTDKELLQLMNSELLPPIENAIADAVGTFVNREVIDFLVGLLRGEITNSGLSITYLQEKLNSDKELLTSFGIALLKRELGKPLKEFPEGEEPDYSTVTVSEDRGMGMGVGFSIKYRIYLYFLENGEHSDLLEYLNKERIPYTKEFRKTLIDIYYRCTSNSTDIQ